MRPIIPKVPFGLTDSVRPLNPMMPLGSPDGFVNLDMFAQPIVPPITNELTNFGWEYVWHCHILSHEEMDMMRPMSVAVNVVTPGQPLAGFTPNGDGTVTVAWTDPTPVGYSTLAAWGDPANEVGFRIERGIADGGGNVATWTQAGTALANANRFIDTTPDAGNIRYRVIAYNAAGEATSAIATGSLTIPPATGVILTASVPSPHVTGTPVTFTAMGQGSTAIYQYRFWQSLDGGQTFTVVQDWTTAASWTLGANAPVGTYLIIADVRTDPATATRDAYAWLNYAVVSTPVVPATGVTLTPSLPSPQPPGTAVAFTAAGQGSTGYEYRFWLSPDNGATWTVVQDWSATDTWTLPSTTLEGDYVVLADVKTDPASTVRDTYTALVYTLQAGALSPATGVTLTASAPSPHLAGTAVTFTAAGQGSTSYLYRFWLSTDNGATFTVVQDWSVADTWTLPAATPVGTFLVIADVKSNAVSTVRDAYTWMNYAIVDVAVVPATGVTLTASAPSPHVAGTSVIFTAAGEGSTGYRYRFWLSPDGGNTFSVAQNWSATATWTLPASTAVGTYLVVADVTTDPAGTVRDAYTWMSYAVVATALPPATGVTLTADSPSPHTAGTDVIFTAAGQGSTGYLYRFWLTSNGGLTFTTVQDWSTTATWTLPGTTGTGSYQVIADVKTDPASTLRDAYTWFDYVIIP